MHKTKEFTNITNVSLWRTVIQCGSYQTYFQNTIRTPDDLRSHLPAITNAALLSDSPFASDCLRFVMQQAQNLGFSDLSALATLQLTQDMVDTPVHWLPIAPLQQSAPMDDPFPSHVVPPPIERFLDGVAASVKVNRGTVYAVALSVLAGILQGKIQTYFLEDTTQIEELNLYMLIVGKSGASKTPIFRRLTKPLYHCITTQEARYQSEVSLYRSQKLLLEQELKQLSHSSSRKKKSKEEAEEQCIEIADKMEQLDRLHRPVNPYFLSDDITAEALARKMYQTGERAAILSDEPTALGNIMGRYHKDGNVNNGIFINGYDGTVYQIDRVTGDTSVLLRHPLITLCIGTQTGVFSRFIENTTLSDSGMIQRFLWCRMQSYKNDSERQPFTNTEAEEAYGAIVRNFYNYAPVTPPVLRYTEEASRWLHDYLNSLWTNENITISFRNKAEKTVVKLAALLHLLTHGTEGDQQKISLATAKAAAAVHGWFYRDMFETAHEDEELLQLRKAEEKLYQKTVGAGQALFKRRTMQQAHICSGERLRSLLELLEAENKIQRQQIGKRADDFIYRVSPLWKASQAEPA